MESLRVKNFDINLQLFAEKTEKPTAKRRQKAAAKGQIPRSAEINSVIVLLATFLAIKFFTPVLVNDWAALTGKLYGIFASGDFDIEYRSLQTMFLLVVMSTGKIMAPVIGGALLGGMVASYLQVGIRFNMSAVAFNLDNINPVAGMKRLFSPQSLAELVKSVVKVLLVGYIAYSEYSKEFMNFSRLTDMNLRASSAYIGQVTLNVVFKIILWLAVLAVADYIFQRRWMEKQLMMSKEEVKEEFRQFEGDPQIKGKIKQKQRQMSMARMMQVLPKADVVITNPTHFAVALQYDADKASAPVVIAKGQDRLALKIREVAREYNIVVVENPPLARSLYESTEIGDVIPPEFFQAVAEVLAFVYKLKGRI